MSKNFSRYEGKFEFFGVTPLQTHAKRVSKKGLLMQSVHLQQLTQAKKDPKMISVNHHKTLKTSCEQNPDVDVSLSHPQVTSDDPVSSHMFAYLKKLKVQELFDEFVTDPRSGGDYSLSSLLSMALLNVQLLNESKNSFQTQAHDTPEIKEKVSRLIGRDDGALPVTKTIDDVLEELDFEELNNILMQLFENIRLSKLFFEHNGVFCPTPNMVKFSFKSDYF